MVAHALVLAPCPAVGLREDEELSHESFPRSLADIGPGEEALSREGFPCGPAVARRREEEEFNREGFQPAPYVGGFREEEGLSREEGGEGFATVIGCSMGRAACRESRCFFITQKTTGKNGLGISPPGARAAGALK